MNPSNHHSGIRDNKAVKSVVATFKRRLATGRDFVIPNQADQVQDATDFELITWLVIK